MPMIYLGWGVKMFRISLQFFAVLLNPHLVYTIGENPRGAWDAPSPIGFDFIAFPMGTAHTTQTFVVFGACVVVTLQK